MLPVELGKEPLAAALEAIRAATDATAVSAQCGDDAGRLARRLAEVNATADRALRLARQAQGR
jgi:hypothetical protein